MVSFDVDPVETVKIEGGTYVLPLAVLVIRPDEADSRERPRFWEGVPEFPFGMAED